MAKLEERMKKRWGEKLDRLREPLATSAEIAVLGTLAKFGLPETMKDLREAGYHLRHATQTGKEIIKCGTEGELAVKSLDDALLIVETAAATNKEAANKLTEYLAVREGFVKKLISVYTNNETTVVEVDRLITQIKGFAKNIFEVGNDVKPEGWKETVDRKIIIGYGKLRAGLGDVEYQNKSDDEIVAIAVEKSDTMKAFYKEVRKFYDAREKNEDTIKQLCENLERELDYTRTTATSHNKKIEKLFPDLIERVKQGYTFEGEITKLDRKGADMKRPEVDQTKGNVATYTAKVEDTRGQVGKEIPLKDIGTNWVDIITNPFVIATATVLAYKGVVHGLGLGKIDSLLSRAVIYPAKATLNLTENAYNKVYNALRR